MEHAGGIATIGLRHVLEDGAAVLDGQGPLGRRRDFVLRDLKEMLQHALRGAEVTVTRQSLVQTGDPSALKAYSLIFKYLNADYRDELYSKITSTYSAISALEGGQPANEQEMAEARNFMQRLLARLNSDEVYSRQREPEVFSFQ